MLPERSRNVFSLNREQGLSYTEIAKVLGISVKTVEATMTRTLKALRSALGRVGPAAIVLCVSEFLGRT